MPAYLSARPSGAQLAVHAWKSTIAAAARMPVLMLSMLAASLVLGLASYYLAFGLRAQMAQLLQLPWQFGRGLVLVVLKAAVVAPLAVAMHRFILLDDVTPRLSYAPRHTGLFFCWTLAMQLLALLVSLPLQSGMPLAMRGLAVLVAALAMWIVSVYLAMIFPAVATDVSSDGPLARIATSARQMRGHFWQFMGAAVVSMLPILVPFMIVTLWLQRMMVRDMMVMRGVAHGQFPTEAGNWFLAVSVLGSVETVVVVAVAAAVASWTYAALDLKD